VQVKRSCFTDEETQTVDDGYPKSISVWQGVPDNIKAAFMSKDQGKGGLCHITKITCNISV